MNMIEVKGGNRFEKAVTYKVVEMMCKVLMPRVRTLNIEVTIKKLTDGAAGYCMMGDTRKDYEIEVAKGLTFKDFITTICHEMVHVKQYYRKEMDCNGMRWKSKVLPAKTDYWEQPWEKEAYRMQDKLANMVWEADIL